MKIQIDGTAFELHTMLEDVLAAASEVKQHPHSNLLTPRQQMFLAQAAKPDQMVAPVNRIAEIYQSLSQQHPEKERSEIILLTGLANAKDILVPDTYRRQLAHELPQMLDALSLTQEQLSKMFRFEIAQLRYIREHKTDASLFYSRIFLLYPEIIQPHLPANPSNIILYKSPLSFAKEVFDVDEDGLLTTHAKFQSFMLFGLQRHHGDFDKEAWLKSTNLDKALAYWLMYYSKAMALIKSGKASLLKPGEKVNASGIDISLQQTEADTTELLNRSPFAEPVHSLIKQLND